MGNLLFWLGIGAAQKGAGSKPLDRRNRALSLAIGTLVALLLQLECLFCWSAKNEAALLALLGAMASKNKSLAQMSKAGAGVRTTYGCGRRSLPHAQQTGRV